MFYTCKVKESVPVSEVEQENVGLPREAEIAQEVEVAQLPGETEDRDAEESARDEERSEGRLGEERYTGRTEEGYIREDAGGGRYWSRNPRSRESCTESEKNISENV